MASEPTEEGTVQVDLSPELDEWLRGRAAALGVDAETVLVQLLSSYRAAAELDGSEEAGLAVELAGPEGIDEVVDPAVEAALLDAMGERLNLDEVVESDVRTVVEEQVDAVVAERVQAALADHEADVPEDELQAQVETAVGERLEAATTDVESRLGERLDSIQADFRQKLEDVRARVVQVKQETDDKAPADHDHEAFDRLDGIGGRLADLEEDVEDLAATVEEVERTVADLPAEHAERVEDLEAELDDVDDRLTTVAWVVSDLREAYESKTGAAALEQLKREAAAADVSRAVCENCGDGVEIGLMTDPSCPHCDATVTTLDPSSGFFSKPRLLVASQLESGDGR